MQIRAFANCAAQHCLLHSRNGTEAKLIGAYPQIDPMVPHAIDPRAQEPVVVIAGFVCGAMLFGVVGLLLAVPTAVCIKIALEHYYAEPIRPEEREG